jgi:hypothetical protein
LTHAADLSVRRNAEDEARARIASTLTLEDEMLASRLLIWCWQTEIVLYIPLWQFDEPHALVESTATDGRLLLTDAFREKGFFINQDSAAKPQAKSWQHTVERLKQRFDVAD